jgi:peptide/nickel transport system substrate-binding protein
MVPWLATSYTVADDKKSVTFVLRQNVKFHDGSDFNATVAKWNLDNQIAAKTQATWESVDKVNDYTIKLNLTKWSNTILRSIGDGNSDWMASKEAFDKNGIDWVRQNPVGTGPFKFVSYHSDVDFITERNPNYWKTDGQGKQLPYLDGVKVLFVTDQLTRSAALLSGEADMMTVSLGKEASDMAAAGLYLKPVIGGVDCLIPDTANPDSPWAKQEVREAAEYAINKEAIAKALNYGFGKVPYQIPSSNNAAYNSSFQYVREYNPDKAKQLLKAAGYADGFDTTIIMNPVTGAKDAMVLIQNNLAAVGIRVTMEFPEFSKYQPTYMLGSWNNALLYQPVAHFANFNIALDLWFGTNGRFLPSWQRTEKYTELLNASLGSLTVDVNLIRAVTDEMSKYTLAIPIKEGGQAQCIQPYVMDAGLNERGTIAMWKPEQTWLDK